MIGVQVGMTPGGQNLLKNQLQGTVLIYFLNSIHFFSLWTRLAQSICWSYDKTTWVSIARDIIFKTNTWPISNAKGFSNISLFWNNGFQFILRFRNISRFWDNYRISAQVAFSEHILVLRQLPEFISKSIFKYL